MSEEPATDPLPPGFASTEVCETTWLGHWLNEADAAAKAYCPAKVVGAGWPAYMLIGRDEAEFENNPDYTQLQARQLAKHLSRSEVGITRAAFWEGFSGFTNSSGPGRPGIMFITSHTSYVGNIKAGLSNRLWHFLLDRPPGIVRRFFDWIHWKLHPEFFRAYEEPGLLPPEIRAAPMWDWNAGYRRYVLLQVTGPDSFARIINWAIEPVGRNMPQLCWPEDKSWCFGWEIDDQDFQVFGGPVDLVEQMCADAVLCARRIGEYEHIPQDYL